VHENRNIDGGNGMAGDNSDGGIVFEEADGDHNDGGIASEEDEPGAKGGSDGFVGSYELFITCPTMSEIVFGPATDTQFNGGFTPEHVEEENAVHPGPNNVPDLETRPDDGVVSRIKYPPPKGKSRVARQLRLLAEADNSFPDDSHRSCVRSTTKMLLTLLLCSSTVSPLTFAKSGF
jgi:hypothetical protein